MTSAQQLITDNIDVWTSAIKAKSTSGRGSSSKRELYGINKLRELILELAVRGKLVPQNSNDEPASVLLERIAVEKAKLIKEKKIKKTKPLPAITEEEKPFALPAGWEWARIGNVCEIERGGSPRPIKSFLTEQSDGLNWIKIGDTDIGGKYITKAAEKISPEGLSKTRQVFPGDFLLTNSMSFGRPYISKIEGCIHDGWLRISPPESIDKDYLYNLLSSPFVVKAFKKSASGAVVMNLNADKVRETVVAIPPSKEETIIAAKVDELMALCDQLEQETEANLTVHTQLVETLLTALLQSSVTHDFNTSWQRIAQHFDTLFTTTESIDILKQHILQLAVMGKLVPQNPNDEPASKLLERIASEKAALIKAGKIKKQKPLPAITNEEKPFPLPNGWEWCRIDTISNVIGGIQKQQKRRPVKNHYPYLRVANVQRGFLNLEQIERFELFDNELEKWLLQDGDLLIVEGNGSADEIGRCAIWTNEIENCVHQNHLIRVRMFEGINRLFITQFLNSLSGVKEMQRLAVTTSGLYNLSVGKIRSIIVPIPPRNEAIRILEKSNQLDCLFVQLKQHFKAAQQTQLHFADAMIEGALN